MALVIGLTGPTGAGKSSVCKLMSQWEGIEIIDCDQLSRRVVQKGCPCLLDLAVEFSSDILDGNGELNRPKLAGTVFANQEKLSKLNKIIFPYIIKELEKEIAKAQNKNLRAIIVDAPTLFDSGANKLCDKIVVVVADALVRLNRLIMRDKLTPEQIAYRMECQPDNKVFIKRADVVIRNDGDFTDMRVETIVALNQLNL